MGPLEKIFPGDLGFMNNFMNYREECQVKELCHNQNKQKEDNDAGNIHRMSNAGGIHAQIFEKRLQY